MSDIREFVIDDGSKKFVFKNTSGEVFAEFSFNPADTGIINRYEEVAEFFRGFNYDPEENIAAFVKKFDESVKEKYSYLFNSNVDGLFMKYTPTSVFANGDFYCEVILEYIGQAIEQELDVRLKNKKAKIKKATAKYE